MREVSCRVSDDPTVEPLLRAIEILCRVDQRLERGDHPRHVRNYLRREMRALGVSIEEVQPAVGRVMQRLDAPSR